MPIRSLSSARTRSFFFNDTAPTEIYTLSLHDALPISACCPANTQDGVIVSVKVVRRADRYVVGDLRYVPTWVQHPGYRVLPVLQSLAHGGLDAATRAALAASLRRTRSAM